MAIWNGKSWEVFNLKTNYPTNAKTDYNTNNPTFANGGLQPFKQPLWLIASKYGGGSDFGHRDYVVAKQQGYSNDEILRFIRDNPGRVAPDNRPGGRNQFYEDIQAGRTSGGRFGSLTGNDKNPDAIREYYRNKNRVEDQDKQNKKTNEDNRKLNKQNADFNQKNTVLNNDNSILNNWSKDIRKTSRNAQSNGYLSQRNVIDKVNEQLNGLSGDARRNINTYKNTGRGAYKSFYTDRKLIKWDAAESGELDPLGNFDATYYGKNYGSNLSKEWTRASQVDDVDILGRYGSYNNFLWHDYSTGGKAAGNRGSAETEAEAVTKYQEDFDTLTDVEQQRIRDTLLGIGDDPDNKFFGEYPIYELEYEVDKEGNPKLDEEGNRIPKRDKDGNVVPKKDDEGNPIVAVDEEGNPLTSKIPSELYEQFQTEVGAEAQIDQDRFRALTDYSLKETINKMRAAKKYEYELNLYRSLPGFNEVFSVNNMLANSILGDSGLGGALSFAGYNQDRLQESLEDQFSSFTGVNSNATTVNWQKWFDETLIPSIKDLDKVQGLRPEGMSDEEYEKLVFELSEDFKTQFIDDYLKPRFDTSRSMNEFTSYLDVTQDEENVLQTQTTLNKLEKTIVTRAKEFYDSLADKEINISDPAKSDFQPQYYFNPLDNKFKTVNPVKQKALEEQAAKVSNDFEAALADPNSQPQGTYTVGGKTYEYSNPNNYTWAQLAYMYGYDLTNKNQFAKLHYQTLGRVFNFDPAEDVVTEQDVKEAIGEFVNSAVEGYNAADGAPFLNFVTPEEFADALLEGLDPLENKEEWRKALEAIGLDEEASLEEVRKYLEDSLRTGAAKDIREGIKYLNERDIKPTQERLGVDYIERDEDDVKKDNPDETELYQIFKSAGFGGSEDDFYNEFMPDANREDMVFIGKYLSGDVKLNELDLSDPFEALGSVSQFTGDTGIFGEEDKNKEEERRQQERDNYFNLFGDVEDSFNYDDDIGIDTDFSTFFT